MNKSVSPLICVWLFQGGCQHKKAGGRLQHGQKGCWTWWHHPGQGLHHQPHEHRHDHHCHEDIYPQVVLHLADGEEIPCFPFSNSMEAENVSKYSFLIIKPNRSQKKSSSHLSPPLSFYNIQNQSFIIREGFKNCKSAKLPWNHNIKISFGSFCLLDIFCLFIFWLFFVFFNFFLSFYFLSFCLFVYSSFCDFVFYVFVFLSLCYIVFLSFHRFVWTPLWSNVCRVQILKWQSLSDNGRYRAARAAKKRLNEPIILWYRSDHSWN